ncbi:hypothetical protein KEM48_002101 [Puccinia striiformis f. sp. tritici PST-130]|nr:hypothetical protein KEM48_002101 [Puccinia striiformis f. sp. tritici PST-130]
MALWLLLNMLTSQCEGMQATQEPTHVVGMRQTLTADDLDDYPSSPLSSSHNGNQSPTLSDSSNAAHCSQIDNDLLSPQDSHELRINIENSGQRGDSKTSVGSNSDLHTPSTELELARVPPLQCPMRYRFQNAKSAQFASKNTTRFRKQHY